MITDNKNTFFVRYECQKCGHDKYFFTPRGFCWPAAVIGLIIFPPLALIGFIGMNTPVKNCKECGSRKVKRIKIGESDE